MSIFYNFEIISIDGHPIHISNYKGKAVLVVNIATRCGLAPQLDGLEALWEKYEQDGLVILGCPSNQFAQQPGDSEEIATECRLVRGVKFPLTQEMNVNGSQADPLWQWLKSELPGTLGANIKWNFTKFLIGRDGQPLSRYSPTTDPAKLEGDIVQALGLAGIK
ncbi:glutathione peroxidase [Schaalia vaccimaxillae]|uniref:glutathione peroxidase n=1 Tax=Schaalia vaccimaxillae TaxID=183916 RepID=UPI0003B4C13D|nr:glutathione peroxidase [Schaalia vaccimaxillae]